MVSDILYILVVAAYIGISLLLFVFGANLVAFSFRVWRRGPQSATTTLPLADEALPLVTVQIPIYNELYVSERIIGAVAAFEYPKDRLQIQVLDDSTDETAVIVAQAVEQARLRGHTVEHRRRTERAGYKAGALGEGMETATGEFIAIFDADFVPEPDFLLRSLPHFDADDIAFVQARWGHVNRNYSWLTRLQALAIDGHFLVEQAGRGEAGYWFNFNGTAGVWRAEAIVDAGGWKADTLTEDLDLSYRAHLKGWRAQFVEDLVVRAEVPAQLTGFRRQQHRWARGSLECAHRLLPQVWRARVPFMTRLQASLHLGAYSIQLLLLALLAMYPLIVASGVRYPGVSTVFGLGYLFALTSIAPTTFFITGSRQGQRNWLRDIPEILLITAFGAGMMVNTARAALQIFTQPNPAFERTAKFGLEAATSASTTDSAQQWTTKRYQLSFDRIVLVELALAIYGIFAATLAWRHGNYGVLIYASVFASGLLMVSGSSVTHSWKLHRDRRQRAQTIMREAHVLENSVPTPLMQR